MVDSDGTERPKVETWEVLKKELKEQFLPLNAVWVLLMLYGWLGRSSST